MRVLIALALSLVSLFSHADEHDLLYELAGWPQQRENFGYSGNRVEIVLALYAH